jgi:hypothetical protein
MDGAVGVRGIACVPTTTLEPPEGMKSGVPKTVAVAPPGLSVVSPTTKMGFEGSDGLDIAVIRVPPAVITGGGGEGAP